MKRKRYAEEQIIFILKEHEAGSREDRRTASRQAPFTALAAWELRDGVGSNLKRGYRYLIFFHYCFCSLFGAHQDICGNPVPELK